jgi:hypothetical protein
MRRCAHYMDKELSNNTNPDNALIATLSDAIRAIREYCDYVQSQPDLQKRLEEAREQAARIKFIDEMMSNLCFNGAQNDNLPENYRREMDMLRKQWGAAWLAQDAGKAG